MAKNKFAEFNDECRTELKKLKLDASFVDKLSQLQNSDELINELLEHQFDLPYRQVVDGMTRVRVLIKNRVEEFTDARGSRPITVVNDVVKDWNAPYVGTSADNLVKILETQADDSVDEATKTFAFTALCQSSGSGKSRALREVARLTLF
jgi:hypothetical protein